MREKCGNCKYFDKIGFCCKRHAPTFIVLDRVYRTSFPTMYCDDWCGDWEKKKSDNDILNKSPIDLDFDVRICNVLKAFDIETIADLINKTEEELYWRRNCGATSLMLIKKKLAEHGLSLKAN